MNTEDFDKAIREKLESLNQPYAESDIDKVYSHVQRKRNFLFKGSAGSWLLYSLSAAAFTIVTVFTVSHLQNKNELAFNNKNSNQKININAVDSTGSARSARSTKSTIIASDTAVIKTTEKEVVAEPETPTIITSTPVSKTKIRNTKQDGTSSKPENAKPASSIPVTSHPGKESLISLGKDKTPTPPIPAEGVANSIDKKEPNAIKQDSIITSQIPVSPQLAEESQPAVSESNPIIILESKKDDLTKIPDTSLSQKPAETVELPDSTAKSKGARIRLGADFQLSNQSFGMGVSGEVLFSNYLSLETGLIYRMYQAVQFPDQNALFNHQHHDFNHGIDDHFMGKDHVRDVSITNRTIEIPLSLKYYLPLKKNFSVYFSLGTNLDIYLSQKLKYTFSVDSGRMDNGTFKSRGNVVPFNNLVISAGLEKQWKSLSIQLQPYIAPRLKEVFYKPKELEFGVRLGVKYSFGK